MTMTELWKLGAADLAALTRSGQVSATEAVGAAVARMHAVNPALNAVVQDLSEQAMARARALDAAGDRSGPLFGLPVTIKVNVDQAGWATTNGLPALRDHRAGADAPLVENLQRAGAVVIGRTNTPEFSFRADTDNPLHGRTHNPWGRHISPGGSSGGAGSAVMAGIGTLAHGNDIGGSLRFPASACGAVTVKPGLQRVPAWNPSQTAERGLLAQLMSVQGLITRHARDLHPGMEALIAPDPRDPFHVPLPWLGAAPEGPVAVGYTKAMLDFDLHPEVDAALDAALDALRDAGHSVTEIDIPDLADLAATGFRALMSEASVLLGPDVARLGSTTIQEVFAEYFRQYPPYDLDGHLRAQARRTHFARQWSLLLARTPLIVTPFLPKPFFGPDRDVQGDAGVREALGGAFWSTSMNFMGLPAGNIPTRLMQGPQGPQPIGIQIVGQRWREDLIVDAMIAIEDRIGPMAPALWEHMG